MPFAAEDKGFYNCMESLCTLRCYPVKHILLNILSFKGLGLYQNYFHMQTAHKIYMYATY